MEASYATVPDVFPLLLPTDSSLKRYQGYIQVCENVFELGLDASTSPSLAEAQLFCDDRLRQLITGHEAVIKKRLAQSESIAAFLVEFKKLIERLLSSKPASNLSHADSYLRVLTDFAEVGWSNVIWVSDDFRQARLTCNDSSGRVHTLELLFPPDYPASEPKVSAAVPGRFEITNWSPSSSSVTKIYSNFKKVVETYKVFFDIMGDIDANAHVVEPQIPTRADLYRRISVAKHVSLHITLNPTDPCAIPVCRFLGADTAMKPLQERLNKNLFQWSSSKSVLDNLESLLEADLRALKRQRREDEEEEICQICYNYSIGDLQMPDRICDNPKCGKPYHSTCLQVWLESRPQKRVFFDTITGACVNCEHPISVKLKR